MKPRIRTLKPEMWQSRDFLSVPLVAQTLFICLICHADDEGRLKTDAGHISTTMFRLPREEIQSGLVALENRDMVRQYQSSGEEYVALVNWAKHQKVDHARPSEYPEPPVKKARAASRKFATEGAEPLASGREHSPPRARALIPTPTPIPTKEASSNEDAQTARLKVLRGVVCGLWKEQRGWVKWPAEHRHDAIEITEWLKEKPYPAEFWEWVIPQVPADTQSFVRLTTPPGDGKVVWIEEKFLRWRDAKDLERRKDEADVPSIGEIMRGAA